MASRGHLLSPISIVSVSVLLIWRQNALGIPRMFESNSLNDTLSSSPWSPDSQCSDLHKYNDTCGFVRNVSACQKDSGFISYLDFIYCDLSSGLIPLGMTALFLWLIILFIGLGTTAEEFFCPALTVISQTLHLNQNVAGVTFLALGNGAPDIFSAFAAITAAKKKGSGYDISLAIGALFGAGIFVSTVVVGAICIISPFALTTRPFLRDVIFYLIAVTWTFSIIWRGKMYLEEALGFIGLYVLYVVVVVMGRWIYQKFKKRQTGKGDIPTPSPPEEGKELRIGKSVDIRPAVTSPSDLGDEEASDATEENEEWAKQRSMTSPDRLSVQSDIASIEESISRRKENRPRSPLRRRSSSLPGIIQIQTEEKLRKIQELRRLRRIKKSTFRLASALDTSETVGVAFLGHREVIHPVIPSPVNKDRREDDESTPLLAGPTDSVEFPKEAQKSSFGHCMKGIVPLDLEGWKDRGVLGRILDICKMPPLFVLLLTDPVVDYDEDDRRWNKWLNVWHCFIAPIFILAAIQEYDLMIGEKFPVAGLLLIIGAALAITVAVTSKPFTPPVYHWVFAYLGFAVAVVWIYVIANEIVNVLQTIGLVFGISDGILGLTLLAWANSIGDFIADLTMARQGFPRMGISACFGGPLLNLLLGLGISSTFMSLKAEDHVFHLSSFSSVEFLCIIFLMGSLSLSLVIVTLVLKFRVGKKFGIFLICYYVIFVVMSCLGEAKKIPKP